MDNHYIQLIVLFTDDTTGYYAVGPDMKYKGWRTGKQWGVEYLLIQKHEKVNRVMLPMQNIRSIEIKYREDLP